MRRDPRYQVVLGSAMRELKTKLLFGGFDGIDPNLLTPGTNIPSPMTRELVDSAIVSGLRDLMELTVGTAGLRRYSDFNRAVGSYAHDVQKQLRDWNSFGASRFLRADLMKTLETSVPEGGIDQGAEEGLVVDGGGADVGLRHLINNR